MKTQPEEHLEEGSATREAPGKTTSRPAPGGREPTVKTPPTRYLASRLAFLIVVLAALALTAYFATRD